MRASLDSIVAATRQRLSQRASEQISSARRKSGREALERTAAEHTPRGFRNQLRRVAQDGVAVIAELKKASPSKGLIRTDFRPSDLALELDRAGAAALSVLTDEQFFQGSLDYLRQASSSSSLPCLRKDFIVDEIQIVEARANQSDAIMLIVPALDQKELVSLAEIARSQSLDVLCEAHDERELQRALDVGSTFICTTSRNLTTFQFNLKYPFHPQQKRSARR